MSEDQNLGVASHTIIGTGMAVNGRVYFSGRLEVEGTITGEVQASHLAVNGITKGQITSAVFLTLQAHARVQGEIHYLTIEVERGARVEGKLVHHPAASPNSAR